MREEQDISEVTSPSAIPEDQQDNSLIALIEKETEFKVVEFGVVIKGYQKYEGGEIRYLLDNGIEIYEAIKKDGIQVPYEITRKDGEPIPGLDSDLRTCQHEFEVVRLLKIVEAFKSLGGTQ